MNKKIIIIGALVIVALVAWLAIDQVDLGGERDDMKNADMMRGNNETAITVEDNVEYFADAQGYFVRPEAPGDYPGVVMIHENRGLRPEIRDTAETLAKEGYMVLAVDLFGGVAEDQTGARALTADFDQETGVANMRAAAAYLRERGASGIASLGWCFGGRQSVELAISGEELGATVVYYGGGMATTTEQLAPIEWPVLGIFGDQDQVISLETVRAFETSLDALGIENEIYVYPDVGHAFANPSGMNYAPEATMDAWDKTLAFLEAHLK
jgi:carboxymethylenebutenolidase